jgi:prophage antirepressor-like protein/Holliday junction resolvase RusA-like endonuclease
MNKQQEIIKKEFEGQEVAFRETDGMSEVRIDEVATFCGWTQTEEKNNKIYTTIKWSRINGFLKDLGFDHKCTKGDFIPEYIMYALIGKAKNEKATNFMLWVGQILVEIRKHGAYISNNEEIVDEGYIKYTYGQLKNTFTNCAIENLIEIYDECMDWHKKNKTRIPFANNSKRRKDATHSHSDSKIMIMQKVISVLEDRNLLLCENSKFGLISEVDNTIKQIKDNIKKQHNISNRGVIANKTKKINKLQDEINYHNPSLDEFLELPIHGFSVNYMFTNYIYNGELRTRKSDSYKTWIDKFPKDLVIDAFSHIDLNKPTKLWLKFDCIESMDVDNMVKSIQDEISRVIGDSEDNNIQLGSVEVNKRVKNYREGKIYILLKNIE